MPFLSLCFKFEALASAVLLLFPLWGVGGDFQVLKPAPKVGLFENDRLPSGACACWWRILSVGFAGETVPGVHSALIDLQEGAQRAAAFSLLP
jgi:hypothetical protein